MSDIGGGNGKKEREMSASKQYFTLQRSLDSIDYIDYYLNNYTK